MRSGIDEEFFIFQGIEENKSMLMAEERVRKGKVVDVHFHKQSQACEGLGCIFEMDIKSEV